MIVTPAPVLWEMTLRVPAAVPPIRLLVAAAPEMTIPPPALPATLVLPAESRPIQQSSTVLPADAIRIPVPLPVNRLMTRLRRSEPELPAASVSPSVPAPADVQLHRQDNDSSFGHWNLLLEPQGERGSGDGSLAGINLALGLDSGGGDSAGGRIDERGHDSSDLDGQSANGPAFSHDEVL